MVNRSCHILAVYSASPKAEKPREPWEQDCGSGRVPQFSGDTQGFTDTMVPGPTSYLAGFERTRPVTEAVGAGPLYHTTVGAPPLTLKGQKIFDFVPSQHTGITARVVINKYSLK